MDLDRARTFVKDNHRAILATKRTSGDVQLSPVVVGHDNEGRVIVSSRETAFKTKNLRRDPSAALCVINDAFFGEWVQIDGTAEIVSLPDAMEILVDYYRRLSGEHPDSDLWTHYLGSVS